MTKEYQTLIAEIAIILNQKVANHERINELVEWYRKEYQKIPDSYKGDEAVLIEIKKAASKGLSFNFSLMEAYNVLKSELTSNKLKRALNE